MFRMSDDFFIGLGCIPMTEKFWEKSVLKRADGGDQMVCHASAWDFQDGNTTYNGQDLLGMWEDGETGDYRYELMLVTDVGDNNGPNLTWAKPTTARYEKNKIQLHKSRV